VLCSGLKKSVRAVPVWEEKLSHDLSHDVIWPSHATLAMVPIRSTAWSFGKINSIHALLKQARYVCSIEQVNLVRALLLLPTVLIRSAACWG
jgi:hypothetical protein